jgi:hypothetical protein
MATITGNGSGTPVLLVGDVGGITIVEPSTPLRRLNYFDGKFLRADDFTVEQSYLRELVALSNQGLGPGVVYGYDTTQVAGDSIQVGPGLAIDPSGKVLLLQSTVTQSVQALIDATRKLAAQTADASGKTGGFSDCVEVAAPAPTTVVQTSDLYVIAVCAAEALCGQQDVYGVACQDACVTATDRPYRLDGIVLRAIPLQLVTQFPTSKAVDIGADSYLRSKVAHSWFADEQLRHPSAISRAGLLTQVWCLGAGYAFDCCEVPLAVVARSGASTLFLDAWTVRRERIDAPAKRYWQWKMRMRPWDVFLAQVLQFQCQLADLLSGIVVPGGRGGAPCAEAHKAIGEAARFVEQVRSGLASYRDAAMAATVATNAAQPALLSLSLTGISDLGTRLNTLLMSAATPSQPTDRVLIHGGIIELPPAGYLPVVSGGSVSVNDQVRALLGDGLDLRFCITTADYIAHAVEEAQHMDRISLLQGIDDPDNKPHVDILVPDGKSATGTTQPSAGLFGARLAFSSKESGGLVYQGAARELSSDAGGTALYMAGAGVSEAVVGKLQTVAKAIIEPTAKTKAKATTVTANLSESAFVKSMASLGTATDVKVSSEALLARNYINAFQTGTAAPAAAAAATQESVDGIWLNATIDKQIRALGVGGQTLVNLRIVLGTKPTAPVAIDLSFHGTLSITTVSNTSTEPGVVFSASGSLNGVLSLGLLEEDQAQQKVVEYLMSRRYNWQVSLAYSGDASDGSVRLDLTFDAQRVLRLTRRYIGNVQVDYQLAMTQSAAGATPVPLGELMLVADPDVASASDVNHQYAVSGLDLVQAALVVSEPNLESNAEALLFPGQPAGSTELVIQAVRDWVAFTKRREKQCQQEVVPVPQAPPRRYRVLSYTGGNADDAQAFATALQDPAKRVEAIKFLITEGQRKQQVELVVTFAGASAAATSDLAAAEADWKTFKPGDQIIYSAIGAVGESDATLQLSRLRAFLGAIAVDSKEDQAVAREDTIIPYPQEVVPDDADGVMVIVSVVSVVTEAMHVYGTFNSDTYALIKTDAENGKLPTASKWKDYLSKKSQVGDFDLAHYTANAGGVLSVDDNTVVAGITAPGSTLRGPSLLLSSKGDPQASVDNRESVGKRVIKDLGGDSGLLEPLLYAGEWPVGDAPSALIVLLTSPIK